MSFLSGAVHAVGVVAAPVLNGAADANQFLGGSSGASQQAHQIAANISAPGVTYTGSLLNAPGSLGNGQSDFSSVNTPNAGSVASNPTKASNTPNNTGIITTGGSTGSSSNVGAINSAYDTLSNYYNGLLGTVNPQQQAATNDISNQYNDNLGSLTDQRNSAFANLDNQTGVVNQSYQKSLQQLGNSIRNTMQGQSNALGVGGAGDSSAAHMLGYALSNLQNQNRGYMNQDMNNQLDQIGLSRTADTNQFNDQAQTLADWKTQQYHQIASQYAQLTSQINEKLAGNEQYRQLALANAGQWAQGQAQSVDSTLQNSLNGLNSTYQNMAAPTTSMGNLPQYQAQAINAPTVSASDGMSQTTTPQDVMQYIAPQTYKDQTQQPSF